MFAVLEIWRVDTTADTKHAYMTCPINSLWLFFIGILPRCHHDDEYFLFPNHAPEIGECSR